ncbi:AT-hook motif nuclear-localized protein 13 [Raphanus sativus]|uniref:AT-hook motif nuclear-localized protein n=1 Tax=Raphanus sativus TaxID=3726 RepID=A0A9W3DNJ3_RAPSA|nr:AT-hook motif nuclear-localized protein 13-like [Raphanus sativus]KAJ4899972.1 AT-hook motif nuclear-localized protein 13 [Raphanus sativus]
MDDDSKETNEHQQQQQLQPPQWTLTGSYNRNAAALMSPTSTSQAMPHWLSVGALSLLQPQQPLGLHGSPSSVPTQQPYMQFGNEQRGRARARARGRVKGRPRKYADVIDLSLGPPPTLPLSSASDDGGGGANANSSDPPAKRGRGRGRTPGSVSKKLKYLGGAETLLTPHIININPGEDIAAKVVAFTHQGPLEFSILSASGAVSSAVLLHSKDPNNPTGVVTYEGIYDIIAMSGSFLNTESNGTVTRTGDMNVHLAGPDGRFVVGFVAGMLVAGSQVQVTVGSFVSEKVKLSLRDPDREPASASASGGEPGSPQSQGPRCSSESSDENDSINNNNHQVGNSTP